MVSWSAKAKFTDYYITFTKIIDAFETTSQ